MTNKTLDLQFNIVFFKRIEPVSGRITPAGFLAVNDGEGYGEREGDVSRAISGISIFPSIWIIWMHVGGKGMGAFNYSRELYLHCPIFFMIGNLLSNI